MTMLGLPLLLAILATGAPRLDQGVDRPLVCRADGSPADSWLLGIPRPDMEERLADCFVQALSYQAPPSDFLMHYLRLLNDDLQLDLDYASMVTDTPPLERKKLWLRSPEPKGLSALSPEARRAVRELMSSKSLTAKILVAAGEPLETVAYECIAAEQNANSAMADDLAKSILGRRFPHAVLRWVSRLRDAQCINEAVYGRLAGDLARRTRASLGLLESGEQVRAVAELIHAGFFDEVTAADLENLFEITRRWVGPDSRRHERRDVLLAGAYVLAAVLERATPLAPHEIIYREIGKLDGVGIYAVKPGPSMFMSPYVIQSTLGCAPVDQGSSYAN